MKVIIICGATATGKSDLAFELAQELNTEIINFDSIQFYKDFNIGSAKPPQRFLRSIKHHLIDAVDPREDFSAGDFRRAALQILKDLEQNKWTILVGGTGFYLQALLKGMFDVPVSNPLVKDELLKRLQNEGLKVLHEELKSLDAAAAAKIHENDQYRIVRALEIIKTHYKTLSEIRVEFKTESFPYDVVKIGLRRKKDLLKKSVKRRSGEMISGGLLEEVIQLRRKYGKDVKPLKSVGYKEAGEYLDSKTDDLSLLNELITQSTMRLAKRQSTWFKRDLEIFWLDPDQDNVFLKAMEFIDKKL